MHVVSFINKQYLKFINIGVERNATISFKNVQLLNTYLFIAWFLGTVIMLKDFLVYQNVTPSIMGLSHLWVMYILAFVLNSKGYFTMAAYLFTFYLIFGFTLMATVFTPNTFVEFNLVVIPCMALSIFKKRGIPLLSLLLSFACFCVVFIYFVNYQHKGLFPEYSILFLSNFLIVHYFKKNNEKNETLILKEKLIIEEQAKDLEELNEFKSHFFVNLSHEMRTPLTLAKGYTHKIKGTKKDQQYIHLLKNQTQQLHHIINNIMDLSKLDENKYHIITSEINFINLVKGVFTDFEPLFKEKKIAFELIKPENVIYTKIDKGLFKRALSNLLNNSLKFTSAKGKVTLKIEVSTKIVLKIIDNGIGIPASDISQVFNRFYQSKNSITQNMGSGIGLSIVKSIMDLHQFKIAVTSHPNQETCFSICIPTYSYHKSNFVPAKANTHKNSISINEKPVVLVVDDHTEMRAYIKSTLTDTYRVLEAKSGQQALEQIAQHKVHALVTDFMMPIMNGFELVTVLREKKIQIPTIVLTAKQDNQSKIDMLRLGVDAYLYKPFEEEELILTLNNCLKNEEYRKTYVEEYNIELENTSKDVMFMNTIKETIQTHISDYDFTVVSLADSVYMTERTLHRKLKSISGCTAKEIIQNVKFQYAYDIYKTGNYTTVSDLSYSIGYRNPSYFANKFRDRFGIELR
ncbi:hybrid sensor histidine kinase/response regulator transcription factor [Wenyingzhuangia sp. IMCC45533]